MKVMCVGHAAYDIVIPMEEFIKENQKHRYTHTIENGGGPACTAAYLLGKWGISTSFIGTIGNDIYGKQIVSELKSVQVDISQIQVLENERTSASLIMVNKKNGSRTVVSFQNPNITSCSTDIRVDADIILFDGQEYAITKEILSRNPNIISVMDLGRYTEEMMELASMATYVICSKDFAQIATGKQFDFNNMDVVRQIYYTLKSKFVGKVVVTLEEKGCLYEEDDEVVILPTLAVTPVDTTGAGDIFHGAFVYALTEKMSMREALLFANATASLSTKFLGTRNKIISISDVMQVFYEIK